MDDYMVLKAGGLALVACVVLMKILKYMEERELVVAFSRHIRAGEWSEACRVYREARHREYMAEVTGNPFAGEHCFKQTDITTLVTAARQSHDPELCHFAEQFGDPK